MAKKVYISKVNIIKSKKYPNGRAYVNKYGLDINDFDSYDDYKRLNDTINEWHRRNKHIENANYFEDRKRVYENKFSLNRDDFDSYEAYRKEYKKNWVKINKDKLSF